MDSFADLGNLDDEATHNLVGWGDAQGPPENPFVSPSGDRTKRYMLLHGDNSLDLRVPEVGMSYLLVAEVEDGHCTDDFEIYVNGYGPLYCYTGTNAGTDNIDTIRHHVLIPQEYITGASVTITFRNTATDDCGLAAVYNVKLQQPTDVPDKPVNFFPESHAEYVYDPLTLVSSPFEHPDPTAGHAASRWQIAREADAFDTLALDTGSTAMHLEEYLVPEGVLEPDTSYAWRVCHQDDQGRWSEWSDPTTFKTALSGDRALVSPTLLPLPIDLFGLFRLLPILLDTPTVNVAARPEMAANVMVYMYNIGNTVWDSGYRLVRVTGDSLGIPEVMEVNQTVPTLGVVSVELAMQAPAEPGTYEGYYCMENPQGVRFGNLLRIRLHVGEIHPDLEWAIDQLGGGTEQALYGVRDGARQVADDTDFFLLQVDANERQALFKFVWGAYGVIVASTVPAGEWATKLLWQAAWGIMGYFSDISFFQGAPDSSLAYMPAFQRITDEEDWADPLVLETGFRFYPAVHAGKAVDELDENDVVTEWERIMEEGGLQDVAHPLLNAAINEQVEILRDEVNSVLESGLPHLTLDEQAVYVDDLQARQEAVEALLDIYLYQSGLPDPAEGEPVGLLATVRPQFEQEPSLLGAVLLWVAKTGTSIVAFVLGGPWASAGVSMLWTAVEAYAELQQAEAAQQLFFTGLGLMTEAVRVSANLEGDALEGLGRLENGETPCVVTGDVSKIEDSVLHEEEPMMIRDTYCTTVDVENKGPGPATFLVLGQYVGHDDEAPHVIRGGVTLDVGQKDTVKLTYYQSELAYFVYFTIHEVTGVRPLEGESVIVTVLGVNEAGTFFIDQDIGTWDPVEPENTEIRSGSATGLQQLGEEALLSEFPVDYSVYAQSHNLTYEGHIWLTNPLEHPLSFNITQPLLPEITVLEAEGAQQELDEGDGSIILTWEETLEPEEMKLLAYCFTYEGGFVAELQLPPMEVSCVNPGTEEVLLDIALGIPPIEVPLPISATVNAPVVVLPGEAVEPTVSLAHRLEDGDDAIGFVHVSLLDLEGQVMHAEVQAFNVTSAGAQNITFSLPAVSDKGRYELMTEIEYEEVSRTVDLRSVRVGIDAPRVTVQSEPAQLVFVGEKLAYTVEIANVTEHTLTEVLLSLEIPSSTQAIPDSISEGGQVDPDDSHLVQWELPEGLALGEEAEFSVRVEVGENATELGCVSLLTAQAWVESNEAWEGRSSQVATFVTHALESLVGEVCGQVILEGRDDHGGAQVQVGDYMTSTASDGHFSVEVPAGHYIVTITRLGFLSSVTLEAEVAAGEILDLDTIHLPTGEITGELPSGMVGENYEETLGVSGGTSPYTWEVVAGQLPDGLELDSEAGAISGTPTQAATFDFTIKVTDAEGFTATRVLSINITETVEIQLSLQAGWNMVSVPVVPADSSTDVVFPGVAGIFTWNATSRSYYEPAVIGPEKGYWVAVTENTTISINGTPIETWMTDIKAGWNMVGSVSTNCSITDPNDEPDGSVIPPAYWWDSTERVYVTTYDIEPGKGYWIASLNDCTLTL